MFFPPVEGPIIACKKLDGTCQSAAAHLGLLYPLGPTDASTQNPLVPGRSPSTAKTTIAFARGLTPEGRGGVVGIRSPLHSTRMHTAVQSALGSHNLY